MYDANFPYTRLFWARLKLYADYGYAIKCYANSIYAFAEHDLQEFTILYTHLSDCQYESPRNS